MSTTATTRRQPPAIATTSPRSRSSFDLSPAAASAYRDLMGGIAQLNHAGHRTPCQRDPEAFTGSNHRENQRAAEVCRATCPLVDLCSAYAVEARERWGVWGGTVRTPASLQATESAESIG